MFTSPILHVNVHLYVHVFNSLVYIHVHVFNSSRVFHYENAVKTPIESTHQRNAVKLLLQSLILVLVRRVLILVTLQNAKV